MELQLVGLEFLPVGKFLRSVCRLRWVGLLFWVLQLRPKLGRLVRLELLATAQLVLEPMLAAARLVRAFVGLGMGLGRRMEHMEHHDCVRCL
jgi:hypothetical protein